MDEDKINSQEEFEEATQSPESSAPQEDVSAVTQELVYREPTIPSSPNNEYIKEQALTLFERTRPLHELEDSSRVILGYACLLFDSPLPGKKKNPFKDIKLFVSENIDQELSRDELNVLAAVIAIQQGNVKRKDLNNLNLSPIQQREAQTISALLCIAEGLNFCGTQSTSIIHIESSRNGIWIVVEGPEATADAAEAQQSARLWFKIGFPKIKVMEVEEAATKMVPFPKPMENPGVESGDQLAEAGRKIMSYQFAAMLSHEEATRLGEDIEGLHDMRVATRRLRAAFEVFATAFKPGSLKPHLKGLRSTGRKLGSVRDLDVFMEKSQVYLDSLPDEAKSDLDPLLESWRNQRQSARAEMLEYLDSEDYSDFKRKFNIFLKTPGAGVRKMRTDIPFPRTVTELAPVLIYERLAVVRSFDPFIEDADLDLLHALRLEIKKLRYTVEYFREVLGPESKELIDQFKQMQDHLGDLVDAQVAIELLGKFLGNKAIKKEGIPLEGIESYLVYKIEERDRLLSTFPEAWAKFVQPEFRRNLASAISTL